MRSDGRRLKASGWKRGLGVLVFLVLAGFGIDSQSTPAHAIAAWARRFDMSCSSCHWSNYRLNKTGIDFLRAGHRFPDDGPSKNISEYLSLTAKNRFWITKANNSFEQHAFSVYMGGPLDKKFSFFAEMYLHENSGKTPANTGADTIKGDFDDYARSKLADAYMAYNNGTENRYVSARVGQVTPTLVNFHGAGARVTYSRPYIVNSAGVGTNPYRMRQRNFGADVAAKIENWFVNAGLVNGTGNSPTNVVDTNGAKDLYMTADYALDDTGSMVGAYAYYGSAPLTGFTDSYSQHSIMGTWLTKVLAISGMVAKGTNTVNAAGGQQNSQGGYLEADFALRDWLVPYVRYDYFDPDTNTANDEFTGPVAGVSLVPMDNGRIVAEADSVKKPGQDVLNFTVEAQFMY